MSGCLWYFLVTGRTRYAFFYLCRPMTPPVINSISGPGNCLGLLASKTSPTAVRGQFYGAAAAIGKIGAFVGTWGEASSGNLNNVYLD